MAWATDLRDEEIDLAYEEAKDGFEPGFNMDDGRDPEEGLNYERAEIISAS